MNTPIADSGEEELSMFIVKIDSEILFEYTSYCGGFLRLSPDGNVENNN